MNVKVHGGFAAFVFVSLMIGLPAFFLGCNPNLKNQCLMYDTVEGTAYDYSFVTVQCKKCVAYSSGTTSHHRGSSRRCIRYEYYPCYSSYVKFHYGSNETCLYQTSKKVESQTAAQNSVKKYDVGETKTMIKAKEVLDSEDSKCSDLSSGIAAWSAGVAFLCMCGLALVIWVVYAIFDCNNFVKSGAPLSTVFNDPAKVAPMANMSPHMSPHMSPQMAPQMSPHMSPQVQMVPMAVAVPMSGYEMY